MWSLVYWAVQESTHNGQLETCIQKVRELRLNLAQAAAFNQYA